MEEYIGTGLLILVAILVRQYILNNPILDTGNTITATMISLSIIAAAIMIMVE